MIETCSAGHSQILDMLPQRRLRQLRGAMLVATLPILTGIIIDHQNSDANTMLTAEAAVHESADVAVSGVELPLAVSTPVVRYSEGVELFRSQIEQSAAKFSVSPCLIGAITERESGGNVYVESGGTYGLMQLDPVTAQYIAAEHDISYSDIYDPKTQFDIGAAIIANAEEETGIDTNMSMDAAALSAVGIYYHGIGFYADYVDGVTLPANVIEADRRLQINYMTYCQ